MRNYTVTEGVPTVADYLTMRRAAGLSPFTQEAAARGLAGTLFGVVVRCGDATGGDATGGDATGGRETVGMGRLVGDGGCFFQIVDIAVLPAHQGRGLGRRIVEALMAHVRAALPESAYVSLLADVPADGLYRSVGFRDTAPATIGMAYRVAGAP